MASEVATALVLSTLVVGTVGYATYKMIQVRDGAKTTIEASRTNEKSETIRVHVLNNDMEMRLALKKRNIEWSGGSSYRLLIDPKSCEVYMLVSAVSNDLTLKEMDRCEVLMHQAAEGTYKE